MNKERYLEAERELARMSIDTLEYALIGQAIKYPCLFADLGLKLIAVADAVEEQKNLVRTSELLRQHPELKPDGPALIAARKEGE